MVREAEREEKPYNYLEEYLTDGYADITGEQPIVFDWSNVCTVEPIEEVPFVHPEKAEASRKRGMPVLKAHVVCPNPRHGHFNQVMKDPPNDRDFKCYHCITEEIDRVIGLRAARDRERIRRMARK